MTFTVRPPVSPRARRGLVRTLALLAALACRPAYGAEPAGAISLFDPERPSAAEWKSAWDNIPSGAAAKVVDRKLVVTGALSNQSYGCVYRALEIDLDRTPFLEIDVESASHHWYLLARGDQLPNGFVKIQPDTDQTGLIQFDLRLTMGLPGRQVFKELQLGVSTEESGGNQGHTLVVRRFQVLPATAGKDSLQLFGPQNRRLSGWKNLNDDRSPSGVDILASTASVTLRGNRSNHSFGMMYKPITLDLSKFRILKFTVESVTHHWYMILTHPELNKGFVRVQPDSNLSGAFYYDLADIAGLQGVKDFRLQIGVSTNEQNPSVFGETLTFKDLEFLTPAQVPPTQKVLRKRDLKFQQKIQAAVPKIHKRLEAPQPLPVRPAASAELPPRPARPAAARDLIAAIGEEYDKLFASNPYRSPDPLKAGITFQEKDDSLWIENAYYKIGLSKKNGAIVSLQLAHSTAPVLLPSLDACLWKIDSDDRTTVESRAYKPGAGDSFRWSWNPASKELLLAYESAGAQPAVKARFEFHEDDVIDLEAEIASGAEKALTAFLFPQGLSFETAGLESVVLPRLVGVAFKSGFFKSGKRWSEAYPPAFSDFGWIGTRMGSVAVYMVQPGETFQPANMEIGGYDSGQKGHYSHRIPIHIRKGASWKSPKMRLVVGRLAHEAAREYARDNRIDQSPSLEAKLDPAVLRKLKNSIFIKADQSVNIDIASVLQFIKDLPPVSILHLASFWPGGFDRNYPDYLPPDPEYGSLDDFKALVSQARGRGMLVVPYTNPTWWNDGPTLKKLTAEAVGARSMDGNLMVEKYNGNPGVVVAPSHPQVQQRNQETVREFTQDVPMDFLFQDQIGARRWIYQSNSTPVLAYTQGLIERAKADSHNIPLMTEGGFDRIVPYEVGFFGMTSLSFPGFKEYDDLWGKGNWEIYPVSLFLAHSKVNFYQHNLSDDVLADNEAKLAWNIAYGFGLNVARTYIRQNVEKKWIALADALQKNLVSSLLGTELKGYLRLGESATWSRFGDVDVFVNHSSQNPLSIGDTELPPHGFLARSRVPGEGGVFAGYFRKLNGAALEQSHYFALRSDKDGITVVQPDAKTTFVSLERPAGWTADSAIRALRVSGGRETPVPVAVEDRQVTFLYRSDDNPEFYRLLYRPKESVLELALRSAGESLQTAGEASCSLVLRNGGEEPLQDIQVRVAAWRVGAGQSPPAPGHLAGEAAAAEVGKIEPGREAQSYFNFTLPASSFMEGKFLWIRAQAEYKADGQKRVEIVDRKIDLTR